MANYIPRNNLKYDPKQTILFKLCKNCKTHLHWVIEALMELSLLRLLPENLNNLSTTHIQHVFPKQLSI